MEKEKVGPWVREGGLEEERKGGEGGGREGRMRGMPNLIAAEGCRQEGKEGRPCPGAQGGHFRKGETPCPLLLGAP